LQDRSNELGETQEKWERETLAKKDNGAPFSPDNSGLVKRLTFDDTLAVHSNATAAASPGEPNESAQSAAKFVRDDQPEFADGRLGKALKFDGKMHIDLGNLGPAASFDRTNAFSYGAWVRIQGGGAILSKMEKGSGFRGFDLYVSDNRFEVHLAHRWPDDAIKVKTKEKFDGENWRSRGREIVCERQVARGGS
jgi:hypothetical protein